MKLYKFINASSPYLVDMIENKYLYFAKWDNQNDLAEGLFYYELSQENEADQLVNEKREITIVSLSREVNNVLMWAHYANSTDGIAIEYEFNWIKKSFNELYNFNKNDNNNFFARNLTYFQKKPDSESLDSNKDDTYIMKNILGRKYFPWKYEKETRLFYKLGHDSDNEARKIPIVDFGGEITKIYIGNRFSEKTENREIIKKICKDNNILIEDGYRPTIK
jgi:hypothetical protein